MKLFLFCFILLASACTVGCRSNASRDAAISPTPTPVGGVASGTASSAVNNLPKIVAFGDSLTAGMGLSAAQSYPSLLQKKLDADGYKYEVVNAGVSGDTSAGGLRRLDWSLEGDVRVLILELGANDFLRGQPVKETKKNLALIIEKAQARNVDVLLAGMYTPTSAGGEYVEEIRELFESLAREYNVTLIPFFLEGVAGQESLNQPDGIHPNAAGSEIVANTVYKYLRPMLDQQSANQTRRHREIEEAVVRHLRHAYL